MTGSQDLNADNYFQCRFVSQGVDVDSVTIVMPSQPNILRQLRVQQVPWQIGAPAEDEKNSAGHPFLVKPVENQPGLVMLARVINFRVVVGPGEKPMQTEQDHHKNPQTEEQYVYDDPEQPDPDYLRMVFFASPITLEVSYSQDILDAVGGDLTKLLLACDDPETKEWRVFGRDLMFGESQPHAFSIDQQRQLGIVEGINRWADPHIAWASESS